MTDDDRLAELFRAAASDPAAPPPGFDHGTCCPPPGGSPLGAGPALVGRARSRCSPWSVWVRRWRCRTTRRPRPRRPRRPRRTGPAPVDRPRPPHRRRPPAAGGGRREVPDAAAGAPPSGRCRPGSDSPPRTDPLGPGNGACADRQDPQLRAYLEQVLPGGGRRPGRGQHRRVPARDAALRHRRGAGRPRRGCSGCRTCRRARSRTSPAGAVSATTASGGTVIVHTGPVDGTVPPPFLDRLGAVAGFLAPRL